MTCGSFLHGIAEPVAQLNRLTLTDQIAFSGWYSESAASSLQVRLQFSWVGRDYGNQL